MGDVGVDAIAIRESTKHYASRAGISFAVGEGEFVAGAELQLRVPEKSPLRRFHQHAIQRGDRDHETQQRQGQRL